MHRRETVSAVLGAAGRDARNGRRPQGPRGRAGHHENGDQKVRETANAVDQQSFPQVQRQTGVRTAGEKLVVCRVCRPVGWSVWRAFPGAIITRREEEEEVCVWSEEYAAASVVLFTARGGGYRFFSGKYVKRFVVIFVLLFFFLRISVARKYANFRHDTGGLSEQQQRRKNTRTKNVRPEKNNLSVVRTKYKFLSITHTHICIIHAFVRIESAAVERVFIMCVCVCVLTKEKYRNQPRYIRVTEILKSDFRFSRHRVAAYYYYSYEINVVKLRK